MRQQLYSLFILVWQCAKTVFSKKVFLFCEPTHPNLGDQAQLMCTEKWISETFPTYKMIKAGILFTPFDGGIYSHMANIGLLKFVILKIFVRKNDIFIGHSGYFFVDHHLGWFCYKTLLEHFRNKMIILPQTVNFYAPVVKEIARKTFGNRQNLTLLCRDEVSFDNARKLMGGTRLLLYPDIVTSLIGTKRYNVGREGVLFCMRNDIEAHYKPEEIDRLMARFAGMRTEKIDTTIDVSEREMHNRRDEFIWSTIERIATYKVVITDRYHGTIFSAIAGTPVIVVSSADHKLSSGVTWFAKGGMSENVRYAGSLEEAYQMAKAILDSDKALTIPIYFKAEYWDKLKDLI